MHTKAFLGNPLELWDPVILKAGIPHFQSFPECLHLVTTLSSTMDYIREHIKTLSNGTVCLAESQSLGRGRFHRPWLSPFGKNIYCSLLWKWPNSLNKVSGLSLACATIIAQALERLGLLAINLKWPNDLLIGSKKLGGILLEVSGDLRGNSDIIIGFGVNMDPVSLKDRETVGLRGSLDPSISRHEVIIAILKHFYQQLPVFEQEGFLPFQAAWMQYDAYYGKKVSLDQGHATISGIAEGVNARGELLLRDLNGVLFRLTSGELNL